MPSSPSQEPARGGACSGALTFPRSSGQQECRFLLKTQLKQGERPDDNDEWIRSLTEAQEVTTDIPEDSVTYEQQEVDPRKVRPI